MDAPHCFARDNDSSIKMPASSDITKPSRVASKGRLAFASDLFFVDNAVLAIGNSAMPASIPSANVASAESARGSTSMSLDLSLQRC